MAEKQEEGGEQEEEGGEHEQEGGGFYFFTPVEAVGDYSTFTGVRGGIFLLYLLGQGVVGVA